MCYGSQDPKFMLRDIEDRVKGVAFAAEKTETAGKIPDAGLWARLVEYYRRMKQKDLAHG